MNKKRQKVFRIFAEILGRLSKAESIHAKMPTPHHGISVIRGEVRELEDEVHLEKSDNPNERMYDEALDVATTAVRFLNDLY